MAADKNSEAAGLAKLGLQNRLLEVAVIVGMNRETGLRIRHGKPVLTDEPVNMSLFDYNFQGILLDILSGPQECDENKNIVEAKESIGTAFKKLTLPRKNALTKRQHRPKTLQRGISVRRLKKGANKKEDVPVSTDFLANLPNICLPEDSKVYKEPKESSIHCMVLTDIDGFRQYAVVLTFYQQFYATSVDEESWSLEAKLNSRERQIVNGNDHGPELCYVPCCVCFVSKKPYFGILKDALSSFHKELTMPKAPPMRKVLEKYVTNLSLVVCPPPSLRIRFTLGSLPITLPPPKMHENVIDVDLRLPLFIFMKNPSVLMNVLACIMHEQRIVFFSSDHTLIPLVMECFLCYIRPLEWHHQYVPVLFPEVIGFVECPGIFMMGCHSRHKPEVEKVDNDLFLVDLDHGTIQGNADSTAEDDGGRMGQFALDMPDFAVQNLLESLGDFQLHNGISSVCQVNPVSLEEIREHNLKIQQNVNQKILNIFMDFMVDVFGSTLQHLDYEHQQIDTSKFLESISHMDSPFYIKVSKSYMFRRFIRQRLSRIQDHFAIVVDRRLHANNNKKNGSTLDLIRRSRTSTLFSSDNLSPDYFSDGTGSLSHLSNGMVNGASLHHESTEITLVLPSFPVQGTNFNAKHFYSRCSNAIVERMEKSRTSAEIPLSSANRAALLLLKGLYKLAEENLVEGMKVLNSIAKEDARFYSDCSQLIQKVAGSLNDKEKDTLRQNFMHRIIPTQEKTKTSRTVSIVSNHMRSYFSDDNTALYPLRHEPFSFILERGAVTSDNTVLTNLFNALCSCSDARTDEVEPECFNAFHQTWQQLHSDCKKSRKHFGEDACRIPAELQTKRTSISEPDQFLSFSFDEDVLKISETVLSNKGNGRLMLTTKRIIFISGSNQECKLIINLDDVLYVKEGKLKYFLSSTIALYIVQQKKASDFVFKVGLKAKSSLWMHLINEIKTGRKRSNDQCDDHLSLRAAAQNVFIADAFYSSVTEEELMKPQNAMTWVAKICKFESQRLSGELISFSPETQEMMVMLMDISPKESKKSGISAMTYSSAGINETPQIWITLNSGKLRLIDTTSWTLDPTPIKEWDAKPNCLCLVNGKELWIGCENNSIYVLSLVTMKMARILDDHSSSVIDIIKIENGLIASAERSGKIIIWQPEPTKVLQTFQAYDEPVSLLTLMPFKDLLCCCTTIHVIIFDYEGYQKQRFEVGDSPNIQNSNLTCCHWQETDEVWAGDDHGAIYSWNVDFSGLYPTRRVEQVTRPKLAGVVTESSITCMTKYNGKLWAGNCDGEIIIFNTDEPKQEGCLKAHDGPVTTLFALENRYMISGSGEDDGKLVFWRQYKRNTSETRL